MKKKGTHTGAGWKLHDTCGEWLQRRLKEVYSQQPLSHLKDENGKVMGPIDWLSDKSKVSKAHIYKLLKSDRLVIPREETRRRLAYFHGSTKELLGYFGFPPYELDKDGNFIFDGTKTDKAISDSFKAEQSNLKKTEEKLACPFCGKNGGYFLENNPPEQGGNIKPQHLRVLYASSRNFKYFGAISGNYVAGLFDVKIHICDSCIDNYSYCFTKPYSKLISDFCGSKYSLAGVAKNLFACSSEISRISASKYESIKKEIAKGVIGLAATGGYLSKTEENNKDSVLLQRSNYFEDLIYLLISGDASEQLRVLAIKDKLVHILVRESDGFSDIFTGSDGQPHIESVECLAFYFDAQGAHGFIRAELSYDNGEALTESQYIQRFGDLSESDLELFSRYGEIYVEGDNIFEENLEIKITLRRNGGVEYAVLPNVDDDFSLSGLEKIFT
ncbi:hypothetical protein QWY20_17515 [Alkalimonas sp. MEB108]|uniref:Uncharacterized protein n=1 Tax=Alkalimonas cellulosilytica TaxID=3058395 RepID=A0ABU7J9N5_9GAMM|nr:hypothetical protein [Alkalimonas sp. MEB108]MEE2003254.1 hypothetical protein [Alkalimonas sp. MEB108]